jgi:hypothetical protein
LSGKKNKNKKKQTVFHRTCVSCGEYKGIEKFTGSSHECDDCVADPGRKTASVIERIKGMSSRGFPAAESAWLDEMANNENDEVKEAALAVIEARRAEVAKVVFPTDTVDPDYIENSGLRGVFKRRGYGYGYGYDDDDYDDDDYDDYDEDYYYDENADSDDDELSAEAAQNELDMINAMTREGFTRKSLDYLESRTEWMSDKISEAAKAKIEEIFDIPEVEDEVLNSEGIFAREFELRVRERLDELGGVILTINVNSNGKITLTDYNFDYMLEDKAFIERSRIFEFFKTRVKEVYNWEKPYIDLNNLSKKQEEEIALLIEIEFKMIDGRVETEKYITDGDDKYRLLLDDLMEMTFDF